MSETTAISWCDHTFSPWEGCQKVSPGCDHCYAEARNGRFSGGANWGPGAPRRKTKDWSKPYAWDRAAAAAGARRRTFPSLCDPFDNAVDPEWRAEFFALIAGTPNLDHLLLTKRIGNAAEMIEAAVAEVRAVMPTAPAWPWPNVWLGATVVNQAEADRDIPKLLAVPARVRFLSIEPMLGPVDLTGIPVGGGHGHHEFDPIVTGNVLNRASSTAPHVHWVIAGGESGPKARPLHVEWVRSIVEQCRAAGVAVHVKQLGHIVHTDGCVRPGQHWGSEHHIRRNLFDTGRGYFSRELSHAKGGDPAEWPEDLRVQEFPA